MPLWPTAHQEKGELDQAIADCTEATRLDPKVPLPTMAAARPRSSETSTKRSPTLRRPSG